MIVFPLPVTAGLFAPDVPAFPVALVEELLPLLIVVGAFFWVVGASSRIKLRNSGTTRRAATRASATRIKLATPIFSLRVHLFVWLTFDFWLTFAELNRVTCSCAEI